MPASGTKLSAGAGKSPSRATSCLPSRGRPRAAIAAMPGARGLDAYVAPGGEPTGYFTFTQATPRSPSPSIRAYGRGPRCHRYREDPARHRRDDPRHALSRHLRRPADRDRRLARHGAARDRPLSVVAARPGPRRRAGAALSARRRGFWKELRHRRHLDVGDAVRVPADRPQLDRDLRRSLRPIRASFPASKWDDVPLSDLTHRDLNTGVLRGARGSKTPLPASGSTAGTPG